MSSDTQKTTLIPLTKKMLDASQKFDDPTVGVLAKELGRIWQGLLATLSPTDLAAFMTCYKNLAKRGISNRSGDARFGDPASVRH